MSLGPAISRIATVAGRINALCDARGLDAAHPTRHRMHHWHGQLLAHGSTDEEEILRVIEAALEAGGAGA